MNILITGGNGYIGQYLANYFKDENVIVTTRKPKGSRERKMNLTEDKSIEGICQGMDIVIHTASMDERNIPRAPKEALLVNAYGTRNLYLDAVACGVKQFVYLSTFHVYGMVDGVITEESPVNPLSEYALTHLFAEQYLEQLYNHFKLKTSIVRLTNGIGLPGEDVDKWYLAVNDFCRTIVREKRIVLKSNGLPQRDFIAIPDICSAIGIVLKTNAGFGLYNISSQKTISIRETAMMVNDIYRKLTDEETELELPAVSREEAEQIRDFTVSSDKLCRLGWKPCETLEETIEKILIHELEMRKHI